MCELSPPVPVAGDSRTPKPRNKQSLTHILAYKKSSMNQQQRFIVANKACFGTN